jgi:protein-S-isoprenylcysteine O-methyltransferase Ste14
MEYGSLHLYHAALALWAVWLLGWMLAAPLTAKTVRESARSQFSYGVPMVAGTLLLFGRLRHPMLLERPLFPAQTSRSWVGVFAVAAGLAFAAWARVRIGRLWSSTITLKTGHVLIQDGPYALTRHPIYTGMLVALLGTALLQGTGGAVVGLGLFVLGFVVKLREEERLLTHHFGAAYHAYQAEVPALLPRLPWRKRHPRDGAPTC